MATRYKVKLNSIEKIEELLQEIYDQSCRHLNEIQDEINKLINSTNLAEYSIDEKAKYSKAIHDYVGDKQKAISSKFEVAKFMGELIKHCGDINGVLDDKEFNKVTKIDIEAIRKQIAESDADEYKIR